MELRLKNNVIVLVDEDYYDQLASITWSPLDNGYAIGRIRRENRKELMHRYVYELHNGSLPEKLVIDHINRNKLDNKIANLRLVTHKQNMQNTPTVAERISQYTGISWCKQTQKWRAGMRVKGNIVWVGRFENEHDAYLAYQQKRLEMFGA